MRAGFFWLPSWEAARLDGDPLRLQASDQWPEKMPDEVRRRCKLDIRLKARHWFQKCNLVGNEWRKTCFQLSI